MLIPKGFIDFSALSNLIPNIEAGDLDASGVLAKFSIWSTCFFIGICFLGTIAQLLCFFLPESVPCDFGRSKMRFRVLCRSIAAILTTVGFVVWFGVSISELHGVIGL